MWLMNDLLNWRISSYSWKRCVIYTYNIIPYL